MTSQVRDDPEVCGNSRGLTKTVILFLFSVLFYQTHLKPKYNLTYTNYCNFGILHDSIGIDNKVVALIVRWVSVWRKTKSKTPYCYDLPQFELQTMAFTSDWGHLSYFIRLEIGTNMSLKSWLVLKTWHGKVNTIIFITHMICMFYSFILKTQ